MTPPTTWHQTTITADRQSVAEYIAPELDRAVRLGELSGWWFIRKRDFRLRVCGGDAGYASVTALLDKLAADGQITSWRPGIYEPETLAFGGEPALDIAHLLFHADSSNLLSRTRAAARTTPRTGDREVATVLCATLLRGAGLDRFEQADVWAKVAVERPLELADPAIFDADQRAPLVQAMHRLLTVDPNSQTAPDGPLAGYDAWIATFEHAGQALERLFREGRLLRGLREVLAHHILFHANRAGITVPDLSTMAALAMATTFGFDTVVAAAASAPSTTKVSAVTTLSNQHTSSPDQLRAAMTDRLTAEGVIRDPDVRAAFAAVPRHEFLPGVAPEDAYSDNPVYTKTGTDGAKISAASQPRIVAMMLHQLAPRRGHRVLEAGAGTGYNSALAGHIVGPDGAVYTIDVDTDLVESARDHLVAAGANNVQVILGDGADGHPDAAPYDRIIATVGAWSLPDAWLDQLAPGGRLVVPLRLRGAASRSIAFERDGTGFTAVDSQLAVFMPLRGSLDDSRCVVALNPEQDVTLQVHKDQDVDGAQLGGVLASPAHTRWTGVLFPPNVPYEWIDLWLALRLTNSIMRMNTTTAAVDRGAVTPMFPTWGAMATVDGPNLAYLTLRPAAPVDGQKRYEIGVIGHGPDGIGLADHVAGEATRWDAGFRHRTVHFAAPDTPPPAAPDEGLFVLDRPNRPITVTWQ
jgi:protein-L-isoaspartate(D-aspartate) O-methyltransferase